MSRLKSVIFNSFSNDTEMILFLGQTPGGSWRFKVGLCVKTSTGKHVSSLFFPNNKQEVPPSWSLMRGLAPPGLAPAGFIGGICLAHTPNCGDVTCRLPFGDVAAPNKSRSLLPDLAFVSFAPAFFALRTRADYI